MKGQGQSRLQTFTRIHPNLANRKQIIGQVLIACSFVVWMLAHDEEGTSALDGLIRDSLNQARSDALLGNDVPMHQYLNTLVDRAKRYANENKLGADPLVPGMLAQFEKNAGSIVCDNCVARAGAARPCTGRFSDFLVTDHGLDCWSFVNDLFESLVDLAGSTYEDLLPGECALQISLETDVSRDANLHARTRFEGDAASHRVAQVYLELPLESFDVRHWTQLPYMAFHEIFVHVAESFGQSTNRYGTDEKCRFREGYMDAAAAELLGTALKRAPSSMPLLYEQVAGSLADLIKDAHDARIAILPSLAGMPTDTQRRDVELRKNRRFGAKAFANVSSQYGSEDARRIGAAGNVLELSQTERVWLTEGLHAAPTCSSGRAREWLEQLNQCSYRSDHASVTRRAELIRSLSRDAI